MVLRKRAWMVVGVAAQPADATANAGVKDVLELTAGQTTGRYRSRLQLLTSA